MESLFNEMLNSTLNKPQVPLEQLPNIDLYMDQVTTFFEETLSPYKRNEQDKILTKTMINNYTKDKILPPPIKKKYTKKHMVLLILTYHLKSILSISDIKILLDTLNKYDDKTIEVFYTAFLDLQSSKNTSFDISILKSNLNINSEELKMLLMLMELVMQANCRKQVAEKIIDDYFSNLSEK